MVRRWFGLKFFSRVETAIIPDRQIARLPFVIVNELRLLWEIEKLLQKCCALIPKSEPIFLPRG
jgi:hypothetical protein